MDFPTTLYVKIDRFGDDREDEALLTDANRDGLVDPDGVTEVAEYRLVRTMRLRRKSAVVEVRAPKAPTGKKGGR